MFAFDESTGKEALEPALPFENRVAPQDLAPGVDPDLLPDRRTLGAIIRRGGLGTPVVVSVIFFRDLLRHQPHGREDGQGGTWDAIYGMWISTIILTPIAIYLTYKATNDSALLDTDWYAGKIKAFREKIAAKTGPWFGKLKNTIKFKKRNKRNG